MSLIKRLLIIAASPRLKGNSAVLAEEAGAKGCVRKDDLTALHPEALAADATPRSSGALNALKSFEDAFAFACVGAPIAGTVLGQGGKAGSVRANKAVMRKGHALGRALV